MMRTRTLSEWALLVAVVIFFAIMTAALSRADLGGVVPFLPVAVMGVVILVDMIRRRFALRGARRRAADMDAELADLIEQYRNRN